MQKDENYNLMDRKRGFSRQRSNELKLNALKIKLGKLHFANCSFYIVATVPFKKCTSSETDILATLRRR